MGGALFKIAYWCVAAACALIGVRLAVGAPIQPWREVMLPWLQYVGLPLAFLTTAAVMATIAITKWFLDRRYAKDVARRIRANPIPGTFAETDIIDALRYLLKESAWGWRSYAHLNSWEVVDSFLLKEFRRAALTGDLLVLGFSSREGKTVPMDRRLWNGLEIDPGTLDARAPKSAPYLEKPTFSELAIPTADLKQVWPRASILRRWWSLFWVRLKKRFWFGSPLSDWLDKRRGRASKPRNH